MIAHIFLDFDGVVHRSATRQLRQAFRHVVRRRVPLPDHVLDLMFTSIQAMPHPDALRSMFHWLGFDDLDGAISDVQNCVPDGWQAPTVRSAIDDSVLRLIQAARIRGMSVDVLSGVGPHDPRTSSTQAMLTELGVGWLTTDGSSKADPDTYRRSVRNKGAGDPAACALIDDSVIAVAASGAAGLRGYLSDPAWSLPAESSDQEPVRNWSLDDIRIDLFGKE